MQLFGEADKTQLISKNNQNMTRENAAPKQQGKVLTPVESDNVHAIANLECN